jgi:hypothetical protein
MDILLKFAPLIRTSMEKAMVTMMPGLRFE